MVVIDGDLVNVVHGSNKEIRVGILHQFLDVNGVGWTDPFSFKPDQDLDLVFVFLLETHGFDNVGLVAWWEQRDCFVQLDL